MIDGKTNEAGNFVHIIYKWRPNNSPVVRVDIFRNSINTREFQTQKLQLKTNDLLIDEVEFCIVDIRI